MQQPVVSAAASASAEEAAAAVATIYREPYDIDEEYWKYVDAL